MGETETRFLIWPWRIVALWIERFDCAYRRLIVWARRRRRKRVVKAWP